MCWFVCLVLLVLFVVEFVVVFVVIFVVLFVVLFVVSFVGRELCCRLFVLLASFVDVLIRNDVFGVLTQLLTNSFYFPTRLFLYVFVQVKL